MTSPLSVPLAEPLVEPGEAAPAVAVDPPAAGPEGASACPVELPDGCYRLAYTPAGGRGTFRGTLRVDRGAGGLVISGDLYFFPLGADQPDIPVADSAPLAPGAALLPTRLGIPVYPRRRYHSYLKGTQANLVSSGPRPCQGSLTFGQFDYTQPATGSFNGTFPGSPGSRTVTIRFAEARPPLSVWPGRYFVGEWLEGSVPRGRVVLGWVSSSLRACTVEIDTLADAVAPQAVPALGAPGTESFATMLASAGWQARVVYDQVDVPKPATVADASACWSDADLHALMQTVRKPSTDLDAEWHMHVMVVPGRMGCSRGKMYDTIDVPREGVVSYSDDGYPSGDSPSFGAAADQQQRTVPRAYLRSACHEVVHGLNQIHQEQEGGADNSIMTTTPSVANVLATATTGEPGVFPDNIRLEVNARVRRHLAHFPDPVVRPGGHTFASWATTAVPSADRREVGPEQLELSVTADHDAVDLGEPLGVSWTLRNTSGQDAAVPTEITTESTYARVTVIDATGRRRPMPPYVIECERSSIAPLADGASLRADTRVYWSTEGFAFERPGRYTVEVAVAWTVAGTPLVVVGEYPVFVNYPVSAAGNAAAAALLHPDVGKWVALGGGATHLPQAERRLRAAMGDGAGDSAGPAALRGYEGLLP